MFKRHHYHAELVATQFLVRRELLRQLSLFDEANLVPLLASEALVMEPLRQLETATRATAEAIFFTNYRLLGSAFYHLLRWSHEELQAGAGAEAHLRAARANIRLLRPEEAGYPDPFKARLAQCLALVGVAPQIPDIGAVVKSLLTLPFPTRYAFEEDPLAELRQEVTPTNSAAESDLPPLLSAEFFIDDEPWANPQVLEPAAMYSVRGQLTPNYWPVGYDRLRLGPVSTTDSSLYSLELAEVRPSPATTTYSVTGRVAFKFPQHRPEDAYAIKLLAYYENPAGERLPVPLIGYHQLLARVLSPDVAYFPTGFSALNQVVLDVVTALQSLPGLAKQELADFTKLLRGILNYQGVCLQQGIYKAQDNVSEQAFRDQLIQHLSGLDYLGEHIVKEAEVAGGRVEISFRGMVAELKAEKTISDRGKLLAKYGPQATTYASANTKQLSILCVLDLTKKTRPPAPPQNNVLLITPALHGFEETEPAYPCRQVLVVLEGNTQKPSAYSRAGKTSCSTKPNSADD
jgi:hypothetical protein